VVKRAPRLLIVLCALALVAGVAAPPVTLATHDRPASAVGGRSSLWDRLLGHVGLGEKPQGGRSPQAGVAASARPAQRQTAGRAAKPAPPAKPAGPVKRVKELVGERTTNSRFFKLSDGRVQAELGAGPLNYRDATGRLQPIDTRIGRMDRPGFAYGSTNNGFVSLFGDSSNQLLRVEQAGRQVTLGLPGPATALVPRVAGSTITYPGALGDGADLVWRVTPQGIKEQIVLSAAPTDATWRFSLRLGGVVARAQPDGSIGLFPTGGGDVPLWVMPKPFMTDASDDASSPYGKGYSEQVSQTVAQHGDQIEVTVRADPVWLGAAQRRWPVVVDPTIKIQPITHDQSADVELRSDFPTTNLDSTWQLAVGSITTAKIRSLIKFPLTDLPPGAQIATAQLQAWFDGSWGVAPSTAVVLEARRVTASWTDTTATWNSINTAFGEAGLGTATRAVDQSAAWHSFDVKNIVQTWLNGTQPNNGFMLKATNETLNQGGPIYEAAPGLASYGYDYGGETQNGPKLLVTYGLPSVSLAPPSVITATGAQLSWSAYVDPTPTSVPEDDVVEYQVHRRLNGSSTTTPTCGPLSWAWCRYSSRVAVLPPSTTSYVDTSAPPTPADDPSPQGKAYDYWVVVKTRDGQASASGVQVAWLPKAGRTKLIVQGSALDTTLSSNQKTTGHDVFDGRPWLGVGNNSATYGITRSLLKFDTSAVPTTATVLDADLSVWHPMVTGTAGANAIYNLHKLTKAFNETNATWNNAAASAPWTTPGGDFNATVLASVTGLNNAQEPKWRTWRSSAPTGLTNAVQGWVATPSTNLGFLVKLENETTPAERSLFLSSEAGEPLLQPRLTVTYTERTPANTYHAPTTPEEMTAGDTTTVPVTVTNTTAATLKAVDYRLTYKWQLPDGSTDPASAASQVMTPLPSDLAPGAAVTVNATLKALTPADPGGTRAAYVPTWDLLNQTTGVYLSAAAGGVAGLGQNVAVEQPTSDELGLERFYQYVGKNTGAGATAMANLHSGNLVWSYNALANPSRGPETFVRLTYNSLDTSASAIGFGWSLQASSVMRLGTPLQFHPPGQDWPTTIQLTDGDGTTHTFTLNKHGSTNQALWDYDHPLGVHLYLQKNSATDTARTWVLTRPDRTQFLFDADGYQSATRDSNGNELLFTYDRRKSNNKPIKFLRYLTDASTRQTLTLDYYIKGQSYDYYDTTTGNKILSASNLTNPFIIDQVSSITDISGRKLALTYSDKGLLKELVDGAGSSLAKKFLFDYDATQGNKNVKLVKITDPRGNHSDLAYYDPPGDDPHFHWWAKTITDRRSRATGLAYLDPDGPQGSTIQTTVTDPLTHASTYVMDGFGRPTSATNAKQQVTLLGWDGDHNVIRLEENNHAVTTWTYDPNTGYPLTMRDAQANADNTPPTTFAYQTSQNGHVADLTSKTSPEGRAWAFGYDSVGNLTTVTDPSGTATPTAGDFTTSYAYDGFGQLSTVTDADSHPPTVYSSYDANSYPQTITDPKGKITSFTYDVRGNVTKVTDPLLHDTTQTYDLFGRPLIHTEQKAPGELITTPAPTYDPNDNITQAIAPNNAISTYTYDEADELSAAFAPLDTPTGPERKTSYTYDLAGNLTSQTEPNGNLTPTVGDFTTTYGYDQIDQLTSVTNANNDKITYAYDEVGNLFTVVDPKKTASADPTDFTAKYAYDLAHRQKTVTDAEGHPTSTDYDHDGNVVGRTDQDGNKTIITLDARGKPFEVKVPHASPGGTISYNITRFEYDQVGNQTKVTSPRGTATAAVNDFLQQTTYDELNRVTERTLPFDPADPRYNTADKLTYAYDDAGRLTTVSAPPSNGQTVRNDTKLTYFDNGWTKTSADPWDITTSYQYNQLGQQTARTITSAGGSSSRTMGWGYFPDGKLQTRSDDGIPAGNQVVLVDNTDIQNTKTSSTTGTWPSANSTSAYGIDYQSHAAGTGTNTFTWILNFPQPGTYQVFVRYPNVSGAASNASFKITDSAGTVTTVPVNQTTNAGQWVSLGSYSFVTGGNTQRVAVTDQANGTVVADAVKLVRNNTGEVDSEAKSFQYGYDPNGNLTSISDASSDAAINNYTVGYTGLNQVDTVTEKAGTTNPITKHTTSYTYDPNGNPDSRTHDTKPDSYTYDTRDLVTQVKNAQSASDPSPKVTSFTYTPRGQRLHQVKANGNTVDYTYFLDGLLQHQLESKPGGTLVSEHTLGYDANGNRTGDTARTMNADNHAALIQRVQTATYDPRDRIATLTKTDPSTGGTVDSESYVHDANDNVISQTRNGATTTFNYDRNRLQTAVTGTSTQRYNYDPWGRQDTVTNAGVVLQRTVYDGFDRVKQLTKNLGGGVLDQTSYTYDPLDRTSSRIEHLGTPSQTNTALSYMGLSDQIVDEQVASQVQRSYQSTPWGELLSQTKRNTDGSREDAFYGYDPHSSVETITDSSGDTKATYGYTAYGQNDDTIFTGVDKPDPANPTKQPYNFYRYTAKRFDPASGTYNLGFRNYDPGLNRFLTRDLYNGALDDLDLATDPFTNNRYSFAAGNPTTLVDQTGHGPVMLPDGYATHSSSVSEISTPSQFRQEEQAQQEWADTLTPQQQRARNVYMNGVGAGLNADWCVRHPIGNQSMCQLVDAGGQVAERANRYLGPAADLLTGDLERCAEKAILTSCALAAAGFIPVGKGARGAELALQAVKEARVGGKALMLGRLVWGDSHGLGNYGEARLRGLFDNVGEAQAAFRVGGKQRRVDWLVGNIAHESKAGYVTLDRKVRGQIQKDVELIQSGQVQAIVWHFWDTPSKPLLENLTSQGIYAVIHP
jgi:RHS repeat-associated protein